MTVASRSAKMNKHRFHEFEVGSHGFLKRVLQQLGEDDKESRQWLRCGIPGLLSAMSLVSSLSTFGASWLTITSH